MYADKTLVCRDCQQEFTFTAGEQEFFAAKGFTNEPSRCPECRAARKQNRNSHGRGGERQMYEAVCARCGGAAVVPFQPTAGKPVYCSDCFQPRSRY
ncbi:MAG: zinc-ribbon domain containing protein [Bacillota bacterium]|nr:zinc-ribbon domain containing protein [Bacillota bacterium]